MSDDRSSRPDDEIVCFCMDVAAGQIRAAIAAGATSIEELQETTSACTGCGTCREDLATFLAAPREPRQESP